jgi:hypothetical protein
MGSTIWDFNDPYDQGPDTTEIGNMVFSGDAINLAVAMLALTDDTTTNPTPMVDATYLFIWDGTNLSVSRNGNASSVFSWSLNGGTATFSITPDESSPGGVVYGNVIMVPNPSNVAIFF